MFSYLSPRFLVKSAKSVAVKTKQAVVKTKNLILGGAATGTAIAIETVATAQTLPALDVQAPIDFSASAQAWLTVQVAAVTAVVVALLASGFIWMIGGSLRRKK
ncbi:MAG: hypothetical protein AAGH99_00300 [Planctomycetota bacterium]